MNQIFLNFNFSILDLNFTILDLVFLTTILFVTLVILHMSGRKIGEIGKNVVTALVGVDAALNLGEIFFGGKEGSKTSNNDSNNNSRGQNREGTKNSEINFFFNTKVHFNYNIVFLSLVYWVI